MSLNKNLKKLIIDSDYLKCRDNKNKNLGITFNSTMTSRHNIYTLFSKVSFFPDLFIYFN